MEKIETPMAYVEVTFSSRLCTVPESLGLYFSTLLFCLFAVHQLCCNNDNKQSFCSICWFFFWQSMKVSVLKFWYFQNKNNFKKRYSYVPKYHPFLTRHISTWTSKQWLEEAVQFSFRLCHSVSQGVSSVLVGSSLPYSVLLPLKTIHVTFIKRIQCSWMFVSFLKQEGCYLPRSLFALPWGTDWNLFFVRTCTCRTSDLNLFWILSSTD